MSEEVTHRTGEGDHYQQDWGGVTHRTGEE